MVVLIFASADDVDDGYLAAQRLVSDLGQQGRLVTKTSFNLEALRLCAKHLIVATPTVVVLDKTGKTVFRKVGLVGVETLKGLLENK